MTDPGARPGYAAGVYRGGALVHVETSGMADLAAGTPIDAHTLFNIASVSKQFTAFAVLLAEAQGFLDRDDRLARHVPELAGIAPDVTLRHLLHHTSGLPDYVLLLFDRGQTIFETTTAADALDVLAAAEARDPPGRCFEYCNSGYFLLALCIESATGRPLTAFSTENIFAPLGMSSTRIVDRYPTDTLDLARGYRFDTSAHVLCESAWEQTGDGQVHTNLVDLAWWDAQMRTGALGGAALRKALTTPGRLASGEPLAYATGLALDTWSGQPTVGHDGAWAGYRASYIRLPDEDVAVAVLANSAEFDVEAKAKQLLKRQLP